MQATRFIRSKKGLIKVFCLGLAAVFLGFTAMPAMAAPGGVTDNSGLILFQQAFFAFEVESPIGTLKEVPIWDELEAMLDNPYDFAVDIVNTAIYPRGALPTAGALAGTGNPQGWQSYRSNQLRRRSFIYRDGADNPCAPGTTGCTEVPLSRHLIHPLNYNFQGGEELRILNIDFAGVDWQVPNQLELVTLDNQNPNLPGCAPTCPLGVAVYQWTYLPITVSPGLDRVEDDEVAIDYNSPIAPDSNTCIVNVDQFFLGAPVPPFSAGPKSGGTSIGEGVIICGADPGEPGYAGFGVLGDLATAYSVPAIPGATQGPDPLIPGGTLKNDITGLQLFDPVRGFISARDPVTGGPSVPGTGVLRKPSLRIAEIGGTGTLPNYAFNSAAQLAARAALAGDVPENAPAYLVASNENDYLNISGADAAAIQASKQTARDFAIVLGKAFFWDMQVGSDGVQACGSCHFHAGADNRTKNQLNPNHLGGDLTLQVGHAPASRFSRFNRGKAVNSEVVPSDFPFHRLRNEDIAGDPACDPPRTATVVVNGQPITRTVCDKNNIIADTNDVMSSMGVVFSNFVNITTPGPTAFVGNTPGNALKSNVSSVVRAPRFSLRGGDPIPAFAGARRVEPRNTPTLFGSAMNFDNFWDGRARHDFNGGSVFGASDPQSHVMVDMGDGNIQATRQIIRFVSLASLATGPALSNFEMSADGRNWAKIGKLLLQPGVVPLANQLVDPTDSVLGPYSNSPNPGITIPPHPTSIPGESGYVTLIRHAFAPQLWQNTTQRLNGTPAKCTGFELDARLPSSPPIPGKPIPVGCDPFDGYVLSIDTTGPAAPVNTNQFTQMEANMALFWGLSIHLWGTILIPDDTPFDRFMDANPDNFKSFGESGEPFLVLDLRNCTGENGTGNVQSCFTEVGNFRRDSAAVSPALNVRSNCTLEGGQDCTLVPSHGTRALNNPDPLMGLDFFLGSNFSLKNPNFRTLRCGECHAGGTLTDHTFEISHQASFGDWIQEFVTAQPGVELFPEPLTRGRIISGYALEGELNGNAQDGIERNVVDFCVAEPCVDVFGNPVPGGVAGGFPQGQALLDNGMYNIGVRPIAEDIGRGGKDPWGWPLSLSYLALKNLGGIHYSPGGDNPADGFAQPLGPAGKGIPLPNFDPAIDPTGGGLLAPNAQDQQINPGFEEEPANPLLPPHLWPWANNINVGDESNIDEVFFGLNTLMREPILEGFVDAWGPFNPAAVLGESFNNARQPEMASWPNVNRVNVQGSFKAPPLRNVELTAPYFHNGGKLTLRQQIDFYDHGGDFPITNKAHRDFLLVRLDEEDEALGGCVDPTPVVVPTGTLPLLPVPCFLPDGTTPNPVAVPEFTDAQKEAIKVATIDFLLELTDERVAFERAPFDHPEIFVPLEAAAPVNTFGRTGASVTDRFGRVTQVPGFIDRSASGMFRQVPAVGQGGNATRLPNFLGVSSLKRTDPNFPAGGISHYDSNTNIALPGQFAPVANPDTATYSTSRFSRSRGTINVLANDSDPDGTIDGNSIQIMSLPTNGTVTVVSPRFSFRGGQQVVYTPNAGFHGLDTFTYTVADNQGNRSNEAMVTVTVP